MKYLITGLFAVFTASAFATPIEDLGAKALFSSGNEVAVGVDGDSKTVGELLAASVTTTYGSIVYLSVVTNSCEPSATSVWNCSLTINNTDYNSSVEGVYTPTPDSTESSIQINYSIDAAGDLGDTITYTFAG